MKNDYAERSRLWTDCPNTPKFMPSDPNHWRAYFPSEFSAPNLCVAVPYTDQLESVLSKSRIPDCSVSVLDVTANSFRLKKKKSRGVDYLFARHLVNSI